MNFRSILFWFHCTTLADKAQGELSTYPIISNIRILSDWHSQIMDFNKFGSLGTAGMKGKIGGVGRASPTKHPHIFPHIPAVSRDP
jgi:hypothetical protein